jgi:hypothetical protein
VCSSDEPHRLQRDLATKKRERFASKFDSQKQLVVENTGNFLWVGV